MNDRGEKGVPAGAPFLTSRRFCALDRLLDQDSETGCHVGDDLHAIIAQDLLVIDFNDSIVLVMCVRFSVKANGVVIYIWPTPELNVPCWQQVL